MTLPKLAVAIFFALCVPLLVSLVYLPGLSGPFLLDDIGNISTLEARDFTPDEVYYDITHNRSGMLGRPVSIFSLVFSQVLHGTDSWGFKYHNLLIHLLSGLLLLWLFLKLLPRLAPQLDERSVTLIAGLLAALWLLHPLMVSTVLYAVQRMAQLSALFTLASLLVYVELRERLEQLGKFRLALGCASLALLMSLAVFSKEDGALVVLFILLIEWLAFGFRHETMQGRRRLIFLLAAFSVLPVLLGGLYLLTHLDRFIDYGFRDYTMWERLLTQLQVMFFYVKLILIPAISDMSLFHDGWPVVRSLDPLTGLALLGWLGVVVAIVALRRRAPIVSFGLGWFLIAHLMESTIFNLELVFEHRNYLASAGLLLIPVHYAKQLGLGMRGLILPALFLPLLAFMTHARVGEWKSAEMVYTLAVRDHPESIRALTAYSAMLYARGEVDEAIAHAERAIALDDTEYANHILKILYLCNRGREQEIEELLEEAVARAGRYASTPYSFSALGTIAEQMNVGRCPDVAPARLLSVIQAALRQEDNVANREFTGYLQRHEGIFHYFQGSFTQGFENMVLAFESTGLTSILVELVLIESRLGSFESAEHLIGLLEEINRERMGSESVAVAKARSHLEQARREQARRELAAAEESEGSAAAP